MVFSNTLSVYINLNLHNYNHPILFINNKEMWEKNMGKKDGLDVEIGFRVLSIEVTVSTTSFTCSHIVVYFSSNATNDT
jgi:hypothetical protein